jgi:plasmid maintenance system antidote protein VapI
MTRAALVPMLALLCGVAACTRHPDVLTEDGAEWVAKGSPEAIAAAVEAAPRADTHPAEALADALARAMQVAPERVLPLVGTRGPLFQAAAICLPQGWDDTPQEWAATIERSRAKIAAVTDPALAAQKKACLDEIANARRESAVQ